MAAGLVAGCSNSMPSPAPPTGSASPIAPPTGYAALGDSYSSGEGSGGYSPGTDSSSDQCHRSPLSYASLLDTGLRLGRFTFVACAGAVTADLVDPNHDQQHGGGEQAQISAIPPDTALVTLTIGGNDAGFASVLAQCVLGKVGPITVFPHVFASFDGCKDDADLNQSVTERFAALAGKDAGKAPAGTTIVPVAELLTRIHERAPRARIVLLGYPELFGSFSGSCHVGDVDVVHVPFAGDVSVRVTVSADDAGWLNDAAGRLNDVLRAAATTAAERDVPARFVDVSPAFAGHRLCDTSTSWIGPVTGNADISARKSVVKSGSFHPTAAGQSEGYRDALVAAGVR